MLTDVVDVSCHPTRAEMVVLGKGAVLQRWDMVTHTCLASRTFAKQAGTKVVYARDGSYIVMGCENGYVFIVNADDLQVQGAGLDSDDGSCIHATCHSTTTNNHHWRARRANAAWQNSVLHAVSITY